MNDVIDALLLAAAYDDRAHVNFDPQVLDRGQRTGDFLSPGSPFAGYLVSCAGLGRRLGRKQGQHPASPTICSARFNLTHLISRDQYRDNPSD